MSKGRLEQVMPTVFAIGCSQPGNRVEAGGRPEKHLLAANVGAITFYIDNIFIKHYYILIAA